MKAYLEKYANYTEKFSNGGAATDSAANNGANTSVKCYSCVGNWPTRNCYPLYNDDECVSGTYTDYDSCARMCGTSFNRPAGTVMPKKEEEKKEEEKKEEEKKEEEKKEEEITQKELNNKINKALNSKLGKHPSYNKTQTNSDVFDHMDKMYKNYVKSLPYDVPKSFSFSIFLIIVVAFTVCNLVLSFYGANSLRSCSGKNVLMVIFTALFLIFSWIGHILPYYGNFASLISMVVTIVLLLVSSSVCK